MVSLPKGREAAAGTSEEMRSPGARAGWFALPLFAWLVFFVVAPAVVLLAYSFGTRGTLGGVVLGFRLENYRAMLDPTYLGILGRSVLYAGIATLICVAVGYPAALYIGRQPTRRRAALLTMVMMPFWVSFLIRTYAWVVILRDDGAINGSLLALGLISEPLSLLYGPGAVIVGLVYTFLPFMILPILASVEKIDVRLLEAAADLGAAPWRILARIVVPLTLPGVAAGVAMVFVPALGLYAVNDILGGGRVDMIGNIIENQFKGNGRNWPFGAALSMTMMAAFAIAYGFAGRRRLSASVRAGTISA